MTQENVKLQRQCHAANQAFWAKPCIDPRSTTAQIISQPEQIGVDRWRVRGSLSQAPGELKQPHERQRGVFVGELLAWWCWQVSVRPRVSAHVGWCATKAPVARAPFPFSPSPCSCRHPAPLLEVKAREATVYVSGTSKRVVLQLTACASSYSSRPAASPAYVIISRKAPCA